MAVYLVAERVVGASVTLVHNIANLQYRVKLLLTQYHTGILAHKHLYRVGQWGVKSTDEVGVYHQRVALESLVALECLNDCAGE